MNDRFIAGFTAGVLAGILMNVWSFFAGLINFTTLRMVDWVGIFAFAHTPPFTLTEVSIAFFIQLGFSGVLGIAFAYLIPTITNHHIEFKGWVFGMTVWFAIYAVSTLFKVEGTMPTPVKTVVSNIIASTIFGFSLASALKKYSKKETNSTDYGMVMAPAMKPLDGTSDDIKSSGKEKK